MVSFAAFPSSFGICQEVGDRKHGHRGCRWIHVTEFAVFETKGSSNILNQLSAESGYDRSPKVLIVLLQNLFICLQFLLQILQAGAFCTTGYGHQENALRLQMHL